MEYDIRPLSFGEILDRSFRVLVDNPIVLIAIGAIVFVPYHLMISGGKVMIVISEIALLIGAPLLHAAIIHATAETYLGQNASIEQSYRFGWSIFWPFIGTILLVYLVIVCLLGVPLGLMIFLAKS